MVDGQVRMRLLLAVALAVLALGNLGCRRAPEKQTLCYEREGTERAAAIRARKLAEEESYASSDRYAWEGRSPRIDALPDRLTATHDRLQAEITFLDQVMHGKVPGK